MRYLFILLLSVAALPIYAQNKDCFPFPKGRFLKSFPYIFEFDKSDSILLTYNDVPLYKDENSFTLYEYKYPKGILKAYKLGKKDTTLISEQKLTFIDPTFTVEFATHSSGDTLTRSEVASRWFSVNLYNNELSLHIPITKAYVLYLENGVLQKAQLGQETETYIPDDFKKYVIGTSSPFFILDITIDLGDIYHLPPAVFYLKE